MVKVVVRWLWKELLGYVLPVGVVGVGKHVDFVALLTELQYGVELELGDVDQASVPGVEQLLLGGAWMAVGAQFVEELFGRDVADLIEVHEACGRHAFADGGLWGVVLFGGKKCLGVDAEGFEG